MPGMNFVSHHERGAGACDAVREGVDASSSNTSGHTFALRHLWGISMRRAVIAATATSLVLAAGIPALAVHGDDAAPWTGLRAGVGVADASWHLGASAGQYGSNEYDGTPGLQDEWDPNLEHVKKKSAD